MIYLYFNSEGNLLEYIYFPVRKSDRNVVSLYIFVEDNDRPNKVDIDGIPAYPFPTNLYSSYTLNIQLPEPIPGITDSNGNLLIPLTGDLSEEGVLEVGMVPSKLYGKRDLIFFKYFNNYQFLKIDITPETYVGETGGDVNASLLLNEIDLENIKALDTFSFYVENGVATEEVHILTSQYHYLLSLIQGKINVFGTDILASRSDDTPIIDEETEKISESLLPTPVRYKHVINIVFQFGHISFTVYTDSIIPITISNYYLLLEYFSNVMWSNEDEYGDFEIATGYGGEGEVIVGVAINMDGLQELVAVFATGYSQKININYPNFNITDRVTRE